MLVCLFFIVAAHKSYRVSVTVATVKRTNSVQEYLTTVFITIQFSRCLLLLAFGCIVTQPALFLLFSVSSSEFVLFVPVRCFFSLCPSPRHFLCIVLSLSLSRCCVTTSSIFHASAFYYALFPWHQNSFLWLLSIVHRILQSEHGSNWHFVCRKKIKQRIFIRCPPFLLSFANLFDDILFFFLTHSLSKTKWYEARSGSTILANISQLESFLIYFPFWLLQWRISFCFYAKLSLRCELFFSPLIVSVVVPCPILPFTFRTHNVLLQCLWMPVQVSRACCSR